MAYRLPASEALIAQVLAEHGPLRHSEPVPPEIIDSHQGRVPDLVLDFWEHKGIGELGGGRMRLCLPEMFAEPLALLFRDDPDFAQGTVALAYGPFGSLILWNNAEWLALLTHPGAIVDAPFVGESKAGLDPNRIAFDYFLNADPVIMDVIDDAGDEMFDRALAQLGALRPGQIYAPMPPDSFREVEVGRLQVVDAREWIEARFLGQVYMLHDLMDDRLNIRRIGKGDAL